MPTGRQNHAPESWPHPTLTSPRLRVPQPTPASPRHPGPGLTSASLRLCVMALCAVSMTACVAAGDRASESGAHAEVIDGVEHVVNRGEGAWREDERWRPVEEDAVEIGALDGDDAYVFGRITGVVLDEAMRVHVADAQAREVRVFSPEGEFLFRYGRDGEGPGEFRNISGLGRDGAGGIAALDGSLARVSRFDMEGRFVDSFRLERSRMIHAFDAPVHFDARGTFHDRVSLSTGIDAPERIAMVRYAAGGGAPDTLVVAEYEPAQHLVLNEAGLPLMSMPIPFAPRAVAASAPDGGVYVTLGVEYRIARLSPDGDTIRVIRRELEPPAVGAEEREQALAWMREVIEQGSGAAARDLPTVPSRHPALLALHVDETGHLWALRSTGDGPGVWDIFDEGGALLGSIDLGAMALRHVAESAIVGVVRDEFDVERVRVVPLRR